MTWTEWWIEFNGRLEKDENLPYPANYIWVNLISWECWPPLPVAPNIVADSDVESWNADSFKVVVF